MYCGECRFFDEADMWDYSGDGPAEQVSYTGRCLFPLSMPPWVTDIFCNEVDEGAILNCPVGIGRGTDD